MGAGACPNCQQALPRAVVESTVAQVVHCQGCHFRLLWGNGRVLRALPPPDEVAATPDEPPIQQGAGNGSSAAPEVEQGAAQREVRPGVPQREGVVEASVQVSITPTALTRRPPPLSLSSRGEARRGDEPSGRTELPGRSEPPAEPRDGVIASLRDVPEIVPPSSQAITAPSVVPAPSSSARTLNGVVLAGPDAVTAPSVEASRSAAGDDEMGPPAGGLARRLLPIGALLLTGGVALALLSGRAPSPSPSAVERVGGEPSAIVSTRPARMPDDTPVLAPAGPSGAAAGGETVGSRGAAPEPAGAVPAMPNLPAPAEGAPHAPGAAPAPPASGASSAAGAEAEAPLTAAQRKEARRRAAQNARKVAKLRRAEKRRQALEAQRRKRLAKREAELQRRKAQAAKRVKGTTARQKSKAQGTTRRKRRAGAAKTGALVPSAPAAERGPSWAASPSVERVCRQGRKVKPSRRHASTRRHATHKRGRGSRGHGKRGRGRRSAPVEVVAPTEGAAPPAVGEPAASEAPQPTAPPATATAAPSPATAMPQPLEAQVAEAMAVARARNSSQAGHARLFAGDFPAAERHYRQSLVELPTYPVALRGLGLALARQGRAGESIEAFSQYLSQAPRARDAWLVRRRIAQLKRPPATSPAATPVAGAPPR